MNQQTISAHIQPSTIHITEEYVYQARVSGVRQIDLKEEPTGRIEVIVPYHKQKHFNQRSLANDEHQSAHGLAWDLLTAQLGHLRINHYGRSNLNKQLDANWGEDILPIQADRAILELEASNVQRLNRFDLRLTHTYQPDKPKTIPIKVSVHILDEDYIDRQAEAEETEEQMLVKQLNKQASLKRSLIMRFRVRLNLPEHLGFYYENKPLKISQMTLAWPIATPHRLANLRVGSNLYPLIIYNPEQNTIEWTDVPLKLTGKDDETQLYTFGTDLIRLEIGEPAEIYQLLELSGSVVVEIDGLFSGLDLNHISSIEISDNIIPLSRTVLTNEFTLDLEEGLNSKVFSPRQHLYFPGVVLDEMRIADVIMLLEDKGFKLKKSGRQDAPGGTSSDKTTEKRQYMIKAIRDEGAKKLEVFMLIRGTDAHTTREKKILGEAKYTTPLPIGNTSIYIRGQMSGDNKRIVNIINEIQKHLKEQFRHVGTTE